MRTCAPTRLSRHITVLLGLLAVPALARCPAHASQRTASQRAVDPCAVLTTAEVEEVIGKLKQPPRPGNDGGVPWCDYQSANGKDALEMWIFPADGLDRARKRPKAVAVTGLGEGALIERGAFGLGYVDLYAKKGQFTVKLAIRETVGDEAKLKALGQKALGRF